MYSHLKLASDRDSHFSIDPIVVNDCHQSDMIILHSYEYLFLRCWILYRYLTPYSWLVNTVLSFVIGTTIRYYYYGYNHNNSVWFAVANRVDLKCEALYDERKNKRIVIRRL